MHNQLSMRFVVASQESTGAYGGKRGVAREYHGGVLLYLATLMELVSVAHSNTLTSPTRTLDHQATPRLTRGGMRWGCHERRKKYHGRMRRSFAVRHRVMCARFAARVRTHGGEGKVQRKIRGCLGLERERKRERKNQAGVERGLYGCLTRRFEPYSALA